MMSEGKIIPFGKYKGHSIEQIAGRDPAYLQWLMGQSWFVERFQNLSVTINNFGPAPQETPEHNAMQVRFLDREYQLAFLWAYGSFGTFRRTYVLPGNHRCEVRPDDYECPRFPTHREAVARAWAERKMCRDAHDRLKQGENVFDVQCNIEFEAHNIDVLLRSTIRLDLGRPGPYGPFRTHERNFAIEIKPTLGDDYPAVLRQISRQYEQVRHTGWRYRPVLLVREYHGAGATFDQVCEFFKTRGIHLMLEKWVEESL
jgi:hypothetical protein